MSVKKLLSSGLICCLVATVWFSYSQQSKKQWQNKKKANAAQVRATGKMLNKISNRKNASLSELSIINEQIFNQTKLIEIINEEIVELE